MSTEIIAKEDLEQFRQQLLKDIEQLLQPARANPPKEWMKGSDVRKMLGISAGTLQNLRITGKLRFAKIGAIHFYRYSDIERLLNNSRTSE